MNSGMSTWEHSEMASLRASVSTFCVSNGVTVMSLDKDGNVLEAEMRDGKYHGRMTYYLNDGSITNQMWQNNGIMSR